MLAHDDPWALAHPELPAVTSPTLLAMMSPPAAAGAPARGDSDEDDELDDSDDDDDEQQEEECLNWACCSVCAKWRVLPPEYGEPPGETDQWRCSALDGVTCDTPEDDWRASEFDEIRYAGESEAVWRIKIALLAS